MFSLKKIFESDKKICAGHESKPGTAQKHPLFAIPLPVSHSGKGAKAARLIGQGKTLSAANIDNNCNFACGQLYVALSRCADISKLYLDKSYTDPKTSPDVKKFYENIEN